MTFAYRGYLIRKNDLTGLWWVEKGGSFICYATDRTHAMKIIDTELS